MKKIYTLLSILLVSGLLLAACSKRSGGYSNDDGYDYWLRQENGVVVYSDAYCPYYVVETYDGYTIIRATSGYTPLEGDEIYGDLSRRGFRDFLNYTDDMIVRGEVTEYWLSYADAQYIIDELCYSYGKGGEKKVIKQGLLKKK